MGRKCIICKETAKFSIKGTNDFYCDECAQDSFSGTELLETIDDRAKTLKKLIDENIPSEPEE